MGMSSRAHLVYGFDLGSEEFGWQVKEAKTDEYGGQELILPWFVYGSEDDDVEDSEDGFDTLANEVLLKWSGYVDQPGTEGNYPRRKAAEEALDLKVDSFNHLEYPRYALFIASASIKAGMGEVGKVPFPKSTQMLTWDRKLNIALRALGITPNEQCAHWLLYPYYG